MEINSILTAVRNVLTRVRKAIFDSRAYWLSFLLPVVILFGAYIVFQVWPFGARSVLSLDLNAQYVYYYDYMYDVFAGDESIWYSWSRNLSGEFMGIIGYYLASPFNLLVWIFPRCLPRNSAQVSPAAPAFASIIVIRPSVIHSRGKIQTRRLNGLAR